MKALFTTSPSVSLNLPVVDSQIFETPPADAYVLVYDDVGAGSIPVHPTAASLSETCLRFAWHEIAALRWQ